LSASLREQFAGGNPSFPLAIALLNAEECRSGWWLTYPSEKYEFVNGVGIIPYIMENNKYLKPPTSRYICVELCGYAKSPQLGRQSTVEKRNMMANWILHKLI